MTDRTPGSTSAPRRTHLRTRPGGLLTLGLALLLGYTLTAAGAQAAGPADGRVSVTRAKASPTSSTSSTWTLKTLRSPDRVQVLDGSAQPVATFTVGARTVTVRGVARTFSEAGTSSPTVTSRTWVRLLPQPFTGVVDFAWLRGALADTSPDVLATATEYVTGAPTVRSGDGTVVSSDADYGPLLADGTREEGADFNDYLGVSWSYGTTADAPETRQVGALDCSGFVRMVLGHRSGLPLSLAPDGVSLPRRSFSTLR